MKSIEIFYFIRNPSSKKHLAVHTQKNLNTASAFVGNYEFKKNYSYIHNFVRPDCHQSATKGTKVA